MLIDRYSKRSGLTETPLLVGGRLKRWVDSRLYQQLIGIINEGNANPGGIPAGVLTAIDAYNELLDEKRFVDFTMIIARAVAELLENPDLQGKIAGQVQHLIVDEYQDVNPLQEALVRQLHRLGAGLGLTADQVTAGLRYLEGIKPRFGAEMNAELYLQRVYLDFLEALGLREEQVDRAAQAGRSGEIVFYNLGKFSQVISDYEQIHFNTHPSELYPAFAKYLHLQAPDYYPEGWLEEHGLLPDAVQVMTVHQAKGMQWPAVFVPCLRKNRFPARRQGGRSVWHVIPESAVPAANRYKGSEEDERRLFYVALTRAERYLACTWAPIGGNNQAQRVSSFFQEFTECEGVLTKEPRPAATRKLTPAPRKSDQPLALSFSELKYYFECPYLFKLRFLYGFDSPISRALGYGRSLHNMLAEVHAESLNGSVPDGDDVPRLVDDHLHLPFANAPIERNLRHAAEKAVARYLEGNREKLSRLEHVEKFVELKLDDGIVVSGRVDLIRRTDTNEMVIVDFKSDERAPTDEITRRQLQVYALGYQQLTGRSADLIEVHNLDKGGSAREVIDEGMLRETLQAVGEAGRNLRENRLGRLERWCGTCERCDHAGLCRSREQ